MHKVPFFYDNYQKKINDAISEIIPSFGPKSPIRKACQYALENGGKRFRPSITMLIAEAVNPHVDVTKVALAVEFFHTASLVADDLPCMDDDDIRRNNPATHKRYNEGVALLVTYALIAEGYRCIYKNAETLESKDKGNICMLALENATYNTGLLGATGGQFMDLFPQDLTLATVKEIIHKKTTSLFEIAFVFGWLYSGGSIEKLPLVKKAASHFGLAFQIADDIGDQEQDIENKRQINLANLFGKQQAEEMFHEEQSQYIVAIKELGIATKPLLWLGTEGLCKV